MTYRENNFEKSFLTGEEFCIKFDPLNDLSVR